MTPVCLMHGFTCLRTLLAQRDGVQQLWPLGLIGPTRPHDDFNFEELLSELISIARMIPVHLGSRLVSARLSFGVHTVHSCTLPREERCARRTNPMESTCSPAGSYRSPFCTSSRRGADRRWGCYRYATPPYLKFH